MTRLGRAELIASLETLAERCSGRLAVSARDLTTGEAVSLHGGEILPTASVIKVPILVELLRQVQTGRLALETRVSLRSEDQIGGSGILKAFGTGLQPTLLDVATMMIILSDNTATNIAIDAIGGVEPVNRTMSGLGFPTIQLHNRIDFGLIGSDVRRLGEASTDDLCALVHGIAGRTMVSPWVSETAEAIMEGQQYLDQVPRYMMATPYWRELGQVPTLRIACKTGFFTGTRVDAGIVRFAATGGGFAYAVANHELADVSFGPEAEGVIINGLVGKALLSHWWPADVDLPVFATAYGR